MKNYILAALSLFVAVAVQAVPVTFQVDIAHQIGTGEFIPGTSVVSARGSFNEWGNNFVLTPISEGSTTYTGTREISGEATSTVEYKFVINNDGVDQWESISNRRFTLGSTAQTLPLAYFNNVWSGNPVPVTFQVNMGTQIAAGAFKPAAGDVVEVRGGFNNWSGGTLLEPSPENSAIYKATVEIANAPGSTVEYKFVIANGANVRWENGDNRRFTQTSEAQTLAPVYFDNVSGLPTKGAIFFQVDLSVQASAGNFDKSAHEVWIRGSKFGWGDPPEGVQLFEDASRPGIYTNTYRSDGLITGERIEFKATLWKPGTTWEDGSNRTLTFQGNEPADAQGYRTVTVAPWYFNNVGPGELLTEDTLLTFRVDMTKARTTEGVAFSPGVDSVFINGAFLPGGWKTWGVLPAEQELFDQGFGIYGDEVANDGIYSWQTTLPRGSSTRLVYKYSINGADNEAAVGNDRIRYVRGSGTYVLPLDTFGTMTQENLVEEPSQISVQRGLQNRITLTWEGAPGVKLQRLSSVTGGTVETIATTDGQSSFEVQPTGEMSFFRLVRE